MLRLHETDFLPRRNRKPELSDNAVRIHESHAVVAAVLAVVPVVAEYKVLSLPDRDRLEASPAFVMAGNSSFSL